MRFVFIAAGFAFAAGTAIAQPPQITIEDDVAPANAITCAGLRMAQAEVKPDALVIAARDAWLRSGVDAARVKEEAGKIAASSAELKEALSDDCAPFEIRAAPPPRN